MKVSHKRVCLLLAGGTALSESDKILVNSPADIPEWIKKLTELAIIGEVVPVFVCGEENRPQGPALWKRLSQEVFDRYDDFDGFVITNPAHDMLYNSIALAFALQNLNKPVVFTGSPLSSITRNLGEVKKVSLSDLGIRANLINAIQIATMPFGAVGIIFGKFCLRAVKTHRTDLYALNIFGPVDDSYLAKIDFNFSLLAPFTPPAEQAALKNNFADKILAIDYYPGLDFEVFKKSIQGARGVMLKGMSLEPFNKIFLQQLIKLDIPVLVFNRFYVPPLYGDNLIEAFNLTKQTALIKFMWALGQSLDLTEVRSLMAKEFCHEFLKKDLSD